MGREVGKDWEWDSRVDQRPTQQKVIPFDIQHHTISKETDKASFNGSPKETDLNADEWQSSYPEDEKQV